MNESEPMSLISSTIVAMTGIFTGGVGIVLGQSPTPVIPGTPNEYLNALGGLGSLGFAVWYAYYVTAHVMPARDKIHAESIRTILSEMKEETRDQRLLFEKRTEKMTEYANRGMDELNKLSTAVDRLAEHIPAR